ncbi:MAG: hypothetical protein ACUVYA_16155, partial [Planctomycetota bacterium]
MTRSFFLLAVAVAALASFPASAVAQSRGSLSAGAVGRSSASAVRSSFSAPRAAPSFSAPRAAP